MEYFNLPLSITDRTGQQKRGNGPRDPDTAASPGERGQSTHRRQQNTCYQVHGTPTSTARILDHAKTSTIFKRIKIRQSMFSDHIRSKLRINDKAI